jgi:cell division protein FtsW (lipid II flippase)
MSYGGSSTLTSFIAVGLVLNVHMRRFYVSVQARPQARTARVPVR